MKKDGEEELVVIDGQGVNFSGGPDQIAPQPPFPREPQEITTDAELPDGVGLGHKQQKF